MVVPGNPKKLPPSMISEKPAFAASSARKDQEAANFSKLFEEAKIAAGNLNVIGRQASSETDIAVAVRKAEADAGLAIEAVANDQGVSFVPLHRERFDLIVRRVEFFEPPMQNLQALHAPMRLGTKLRRWAVTMSKTQGL